MDTSAFTSHCHSKTSFYLYSILKCLFFFNNKQNGFLFLTQGAEAQVYKGSQRDFQATGIRQQRDEGCGLLPLTVQIHVCAFVDNEPPFPYITCCKDTEIRSQFQRDLGFLPPFLSSYFVSCLKLSYDSFTS